jgi:hypothetical protein
VAELTQESFKVTFAVGCVGATVKAGAYQLGHGRPADER